MSDKLTVGLYVEKREKEEEANPKRAYFFSGSEIWGKSSVWRGGRNDVCK